MTIGSVYPFIRINDILDQLGHFRLFSTFDLASAYNQVLIHPLDHERTGFNSKYNNYEFKRLAFGFQAVPITFQSLLDNVLSSFQGLKCFVQLNVIVIYGKNLRDHIVKLVAVFRRQRNLIKIQSTKM